MADITACSEHDLRAALTLVLRNLPAEQRAPLVDSLAKLRDEPLGPFQALVLAKEGEELIAAAWGQPQAGRTCSLWPPQAVEGPLPDQLAIEMIRRVVDIADGAGASLCQTLLESRTDRIRTPLLQNGFKELAQLSYLQWTPHSGHSAAVPDGLGIEPYDPKRSRRLEKLIPETYVRTLDFPELDGLRDIRDVLHGYRCAGEFRPEDWNYLTYRNQDIGALLLTEYPDSKQLELVYMGVVAGVRGLGFGAGAVSFAQQRAVERGVQRMVLAVDERNQPAQAIYRRAGFKKWAERFAYVRPKNNLRQ